MLRVIAFLFFAPYWLHFIVAAGLAFGGNYVLDSAKKADARRIAIAAQPQPAVQAIEDFTPTGGKRGLEEVNLRAEMIPADSIALIERDKSGTVKREYILHLFFAADAAADAGGRTGERRAYAGVVVRKADQDKFGQWMQAQWLKGGGQSGDGPIFDIEGFKQSPLGESLARKGMEKYGVERSKDFFYISPFYKGRAVGVAYTSRDLEATANAIAYYYPAFALLLTGFLRLLWVRTIGKRAAARKLAAKPAVVQPAAVPQPVPEAAPVMRAPLQSNDFIGAISARKAEAEAVAAKAAGPAIVSSRSLGARLGGGFGKTLRKVAGFAVALVLYALFMNFNGSSGFPAAISLMSDKGHKLEAPLAVAPVVVDMAVPQGETAAVEAETAVAVEPVVSAAAPQAVAVGALKDVAMDPAAILATAKQWAADLGPELAAQSALWRAQPPLGLVAGLGGIAFALLALIMLRRKGAGAARKAEMDPFERLLQRRLAEKAHAEKAMMGGLSVQRA